MNVEKLLQSMSMEEKVGQMCVPILQKSYIGLDIEKCIKEYHVGMLRFCPNAEYDGHSEVVGEPNQYLTASEMAAFLNIAQKMAKIPLFIAVDQEGSIRNDVNRAGAFAYSGHMSFGAADDADLTYRVAYATGKEFKAMGINLVQAPIVDVLTYSGRKTMKSASFGENVEKVCEHALAMMKGYQDAGIAAMAKHFPGYGSVATDAHKGLAEITKSFEALEAEDIAPMKVLFEHGLNGVMTGHVLTHCVDKEYPATLSAKMMRGYLREKLGFDGIVESDAMRMPAIQKLYGTAEASVMAVMAGCDLILLRGDLQHFEEGYFAVLEAAKNSKIPMEYIDESVKRILEQKNTIGLLDDPFVDEQQADYVVGCKEHKELARVLAEKSVSLLRKKSLPVAQDKRILTVCVEPQKLLAAQDEEQCVDMLYKAVRKQYPYVDGIVVKLQPTQNEIERVMADAGEYDVIIIGTCNALLYDSQAELCRKLLETKKDDCVIVAMDSPYDYEVVPEVENYICTYGVAAANADVAAEIIAGKYETIAKPPITLDAMFYGRAAIETLMRRFDAASLPPKGEFHYHQGVCLSSVYQMYLECGDERYFQYMKDWVDSMITEDGAIIRYDAGKLDDLQPGILLFPLYERTGETKYKKALDSIMPSILNFPRNTEGGFWHNVYRCINQMWLDGLYMAGPISAEYAKKFNAPEYLELAIHQALLMQEKTRDGGTGLWYHAWDEDRKALWADSETGLAPEFWGRSIGWVPIAVLDEMEHMDSTHPDYEKLAELVRNLLEAVCKFQSEDGRWYQVVDKGSKEGNWLENSCSCLYTAAICRAADKGILNRTYLENARKGYQSVIKSLTWEGEDLLIGQICIGTAVGDYEHYCNRPVSTNDLHGIGAFLLMCAAVHRSLER